MSPQSTGYQPRVAAQGVLYRVVLDHLETFLAEAERLRGGAALPRFVEEEFRGFLRCGQLAAGFARFRCSGCGFDRLVPFSCKGRGFCPSCGGRRMAERAAHLVDHVLLPLGVRQWVLSFPHRVRYLLAWDHALCRAVVGVVVRAILGSLRVRARKAGLPDGRGGAVAIVQRFGSALNLNVHVHALVLDGVVAQPASGLARFVPLPAPGDGDVRVVLETARRRVLRLLRRRGLLDAPDGFIAVDELAEESPALAGISAAAVMGTAALGPRTGLRVRRGGESAEWQEREAPAPGPRQARNDGFDLHANVVAPAGDRGRLERLCRYALRPPIAQERLSFAGDGQVCLQLRRRWSDGTTHLLFDPVELLERLAAITPRPRINLILYYGVLAPRARWRSSVVPHTGPAVGDGDRCGGEDRGRAMSVPQPRSGDAPEPEEGDRNDRSSAPTVGRENRGSEWAELMRRTFGYDVLACPRCGGRLRLIALIEHTLVIQRILRHLGLQTDLPPPAPARAACRGDCPVG